MGDDDGGPVREGNRKTLSQNCAGTGMKFISAVPPGLTRFPAPAYYRTIIRYPLITEGTPAHLQGFPFGLPSEGHSFGSAHRFPPAAALCVAGNELLFFLIGLV